LSGPHNRSWGCGREKYFLRRENRKPILRSCTLNLITTLTYLPDWEYRISTSSSSGAELPLLKVLAFSTTFFHFTRSWTHAVQFLKFSWRIFCIILSSHLCLGLPLDLTVVGDRIST
jgi:hypothetical protein